jgi:hypothetical protein
MLTLLGSAWLLAQVDIALPNYPALLTDAMFATFRRYPESVRAFLLGFITGSAAHTAADWLVTGGKRYLRMIGIRVRRSYTDHDRWMPRERRARAAG